MSLTQRNPYQVLIASAETEGYQVLVTELRVAGAEVHIIIGNSGRATAYCQGWLHLLANVGGPCPYEMLIPRLAIILVLPHGMSIYDVQPHLKEIIEHMDRFLAEHPLDSSKVDEGTKMIWNQWMKKHGKEVTS